MNATIPHTLFCISSSPFLCSMYFCNQSKTFLCSSVSIALRSTCSGSGYSMFFFIFFCTRLPQPSSEGIEHPFMLAYIVVMFSCRRMKGSAFGMNFPMSLQPLLGIGNFFLSSLIVRIQAAFVINNKCCISVTCS